MTPTLYWRLLVVVALALGAWYVVHVIRDNAKLSQAVLDLSTAVNIQTERAERIEAAMVANQTHDDTERRQASAGVARNEQARRSDPDVIAIDRPWPAAVRGRVFDNPDPASGSTTAAGAAPARER